MSEKYQAENKDIAGSQFRHANMSGAVFEDVDLSGAKFFNVNLRDSNVGAVDFGAASYTTSVLTRPFPKNSSTVGN